MTQKELSYVEDAIGHENSIISICDDIIERLDDEELIGFMNDEVKKHSKTKSLLLDMLEDIKDER